MVYIGHIDQTCTPESPLRVLLVSGKTKVLGKQSARKINRVARFIFFIFKIMSDKETSTLDSLKRLEEQKKKQVLAKILSKAKENAKEILSLKERYHIYMEELGISKKEAKAIIDWINSLPDVQLTKEDKESLRDEVREELSEKKKDVEKKIEESCSPGALAFYASTTHPLSPVPKKSYRITDAVSSLTTSCDTPLDTNIVYCSNGDFEVK